MIEYHPCQIKIPGFDKMKPAEEFFYKTNLILLLNSRKFLKIFAIEYTALKKCSTLFLLISKPDVAAEGRESLAWERKKSTGPIKNP